VVSSQGYNHGDRSIEKYTKTSGSGKENSITAKPKTTEPKSSTNRTQPYGKQNNASVKSSTGYGGYNRAELGKSPVKTAPTPTKSSNTERKTNNSKYYGKPAPKSNQPTNSYQGKSKPNNRPEYAKPKSNSPEPKNYTKPNRTYNHKSYNTQSKSYKAPSREHNKLSHQNSKPQNTHYDFLHRCWFLAVMNSFYYLLGPLMNVV